MRKLLVPVLFGCLVAVGCSQQPKATTGKAGTGKAGTPTKVEPTKTETPAGKGKVTLELTAIEVEEGKDAEAVIKVVREEFKDGVVVEFDAAEAEGVKIEPTKVEVKPDETSAKVKVTLDKDKKGGKVKVKATGKDVPEYKGDFEVKKK